MLLFASKHHQGHTKVPEFAAGCVPLKARALKERWEHLATKVLFQMPKFAILDETTSALDMANESKCMLVLALGGIGQASAGPSL